LEKELAHFEKIKAELLQKYDGKFALIHEEQFIGAFDSPENAYQEGIKRFKKGPFLVKRISEHEEVYRNQALFLGIMNARLGFLSLDPGNRPHTARIWATDPRFDWNPASA
ncbi:MAG: hypothetical protein A3G20_09970, partial [Acidobacteria bacterium RIFCSPLOWO2_12_FULL_59_11]